MISTGVIIYLIYFRPMYKFDKESQYKDVEVSMLP